MSITSIGKKWAKQVHNGGAVWESGVPARRRWDCYDSYVAAGYQPTIAPPAQPRP